MKMRTVAEFVAAAIISVAIAGVAFADDCSHRARELVREGQIMPLETLMEKTANLRSGRVLEVELKKKHRLYIYEIETVDDNGVVWEYRFNAVTGDLIDAREDD